MADHFARARAMSQQGYGEDAVEELARGLQAAGVELEIEVDDRGSVLVERPYDPVFVSRLRRIPGTTRDETLGRWRLRADRITPLITLLDQLAGPLCSDEGCALIDGDAPSSEHQEAHERVCA